jgi:hypothetical protein
MRWKIRKLINRAKGEKLPVTLNKKAPHIHKYELMDFGRHGKKTFRCILTNCPHFLPQISMAIGRLSVCWGDCGVPLELKPEHLTIKRPMCNECKEERKLRLSMNQLIPDEKEANLN